MNDPVNRPAHYTTGRIEVIDFIEDQKLSFHLGNCIKYIARSKHKGDELRDLQKARWYLNRVIENLEAGSKPIDELRQELVAQGGYKSGRKIL